MWTETVEDLSFVLANDLNDDGTTDFVIGGRRGVEFLTTNESGLYVRRTVFPWAIFQAHTVDLDRDGNRDVIAVSGFSSLSVYRGYGDGAFADPEFTSFPTGNVRGLDRKDLNADGYKDIVVASQSGDCLYVLMNNAGTLAAPVAVPLEGDAFTLALLDLNGDELPEAVVTSLSGDIYLTRNDPQLWLVLDRTIAVGGSTYWVRAGDFNNDGHDDFVIATRDSEDNIHVFLNDAMGGLLDPWVTTVPGRPIEIDVGHVNDDDVEDLVITALDVPNSATVLHGVGDGTFEIALTMPLPRPTSAVFTDFNNDGHTDIVAATTGARSELAFFDAIPPVKNCAADLDNDLDADIDDIDAFVLAFLDASPVADIDFDADTDIDDISAFVEAFIAGCD